MFYRSKTDRVLRTKKPRARLPETMFPSPSVMAQTEENNCESHSRGLESERDGLQASGGVVGAHRTDC